MDDPHKAGHDETGKGGRYPATRARARATERTILLLVLALAICRTAFAIGYFDVSYRGLAILMAFAATAIVFFAVLACIVIQFLIPLLKGIFDRG